MIKFLKKKNKKSLVKRTEKNCSSFAFIRMKQVTIKLSFVPFPLMSLNLRRMIAKKSSCEVTITTSSFSPLMKC